MPTLSDPSQPARRPRAALYAPLADDGQRWVMAGVEWCDRLGYDLCSLVVDPDGSRWREVFQLLLTGDAEVIVVNRRDHIPLTLPRIEIIAEDRRRVVPPAQPPGPGRRRPQFLR
jgi:hypothetical protein